MRRHFVILSADCFYLAPSIDLIVAVEFVRIHEIGTAWVNQEENFQINSFLLI